MIFSSFEVILNEIYILFRVVLLDGEQEQTLHEQLESVSRVLWYRGS
jgi:hypothetical protein